MQFTCGKNDLSKAIAIASRAIPKVQQSISDCILFETQDDKIVLKATDENISIKTRVEAQIDSAGRMAVPARILSEFVNHLPEADVTMKMIGDNIVEVKCQAAKSRIQLMKAQEFPAFPQVKRENPVTIPADQFVEMVNRTIFAVSPNDDRPILTGILFHIENESLRFVAVDGFRMAIRQEPVSAETQGDYLVPARALRELSRSLGDTTENLSIYFDGRRVLFQTENMQVTAQLLEGEYLPYQNFFPDSYATYVQADRELLLDSVERADIIARHADLPVIKLNISENILDIKANVETASSAEPIPVITRGDDITIALNSRYLMDVLRAVDDPEVTLTFNTPTTPCVIERKGLQSYHYLILPVQIRTA